MNEICSSKAPSVQGLWSQEPRSRNSQECRTKTSKCRKAMSYEYNLNRLLVWKTLQSLAHGEKCGGVECSKPFIESSGGDCSGKILGCRQTNILLTSPGWQKIAANQLNFLSFWHLREAAHKKQRAPYHPDRKINIHFKTWEVCKTNKSRKFWNF